MNKYTVTITANYHVEANSSEEALVKVREELPIAFDLIEDEVHNSEDDDD